MFYDDVSSVQHAQNPKGLQGVRSVSQINLQQRPPKGPYHKSMSRDAVESMGMYFSNKEVQLMKKACGAVSKEELM